MIQDATGKEEKTLTYYNLKLSDFKTINLYEKDNYTYIKYKAKDGTKGNWNIYRTLTFDKRKKRYLLTNMNVRILPDNVNGEIKEKYVAGQKIYVYGKAIGIMNGEASEWYLIKTNSGYGYISAEDKYSTNDKAKVPKAAKVSSQSTDNKSDNKTYSNATSNYDNTGSSSGYDSNNYSGDSDTDYSGGSGSYTENNTDSSDNVWDATGDDDWDDVWDATDDNDW